MRFLFMALMCMALTGCFDEQKKAHSLNFLAGGYSGRAMQESLPSPALPAPPPPPMDMPLAGSASDMALDRSQFEGRRIAETHQLNIETARDKLHSRYQRDLKECVTLGCQIIDSQVQSDGYGYLNARVSPDNLGKYLDFLTRGPGTVKRHQLSADDMTMQYVDTESRLKNQMALRDRLLKLLETHRSQKIEDILNVERELARVQGDIDSLTGQMQALAQQTEKVMVRVEYTIPPKGVEIEYHDISNSLRYAWNGFLQSISGVIGFVLRVLPWIPIWFAGGWLAVKIFRFAFRKSGRLASGIFFWKHNTGKGAAE